MTEERQKGISRRTVVKGAAWAVPAVPIVVATPAYAASPTCLRIELSGDACKWPGAGEDWSYYFQLCFYNDCGGTYTIWIDEITNNSGKPFALCPDSCADGATPLPTGPGRIAITVSPDEPTCYGPCAYSSTSSAHNVVVWGSFTENGPSQAILTTPAPTVPCLGESPCP